VFALASLSMPEAARISSGLPLLLPVAAIASADFAEAVDA
jgi:hypothetical protein